MRPILFLSCEHAGNEIPAPYKKLFAKSPGVLKTHRGSDPGAFAVAKEMARLTKTPLFYTKVSRLVVDMNRSPNSETALSRWTRSLPESEQQKIIDRYYAPYRKSIDSAVDRLLKKARVVHLGIHSFSPYLDPSRKTCDIGLLFDPKSRFEVESAETLKANLENVFPDLGIKMNFPYRGDADGLTTDLRQRHKSVNKSERERYAGLEIEFNQALLRKIIARKTLKSFVGLFTTAVRSSMNEL